MKHNKMNAKYSNKYSEHDGKLVRDMHDNLLGMPH